ncbi:MAG: primosomal protein N', partial [Muribaculaceae bacterium]|nr:primosomal protein N' [Muribaculaceae bacterium]
VLSADMLIHYPFLRSSVWELNMLMQVAGRAGRRDTAGKVIVQTSEPKHPVITFLTSHDYRGFFEHELAERRRHLYPPFTRLIYIYLKHQNEETVAIAAEKFTHKLIELLGNRVFGPEKPAVGRVQQLHIRKIMLKIETGASMQKVKNLLRTLQANLLPSFKGVTIHYDVDPM